MATVTAGANYALNMDTLDLYARRESGYYNEEDSHISGGAIRFWHNDGQPDGEIPDHQKNYTRFVGENLHSSLGTIDKIKVVSNLEDELTIKDFSMNRDELFGYLTQEGGTQEFFSSILGDADVITGSRYADVLNGLGGDDVLNGRQGSDTLSGGEGCDTFVFDAALGKANVDTITDFSAVDDTLYLDDLFFKGLGTGTIEGTAITEAMFSANDTGKATSKAGSAQIVYETDTGNLFYDADGMGRGAAVLFANVGANRGLTYADIEVT